MKINFDVSNHFNDLIERFQKVYKGLYDEHLSKTTVLTIFLMTANPAIKKRLTDLENQLIEHNKMKNEKLI